MGRRRGPAARGSSRPGREEAMGAGARPAPGRLAGGGGMGRRPPAPGVHRAGRGVKTGGPRTLASSQRRRRTSASRPIRLFPSLARVGSPQPHRFSQVIPMERSRVWLVTGASRGLGLALAREVARRGEGLVICARGAEGLAQAAAQLRALGASVHARAGDVADRDLARRLVAEGTERFGRIDVLVNNASLLGPSPLPPLAQYPLAQLEEVFAANVFGPLALIQAVLPGMLARGHGLIVNISSDAAVGGYPGWGGYGASKAALDLITHTLANELAGTGVGAVAIDPGDMRTQMHQAAFPGEDI